MIESRTFICNRIGCIATVALRGLCAVCSAGCITVRFVVGEGVIESSYFVCYVGVAASTSVSGVTFLGTGGCGYYGSVAMSKSVDLNGLAADFRAANGTVNYVVVAAFGITIGSDFVFYNSFSFGVSESVDFIIFVCITTYGAGICGITLIGTSRCGYYGSVAMSEGRTYVCDRIGYVATVALRGLGTVFGAGCIAVRFVFCEGVIQS
jgi:hypothetical protein